MPYTYEYITHQSLNANQATVTFSNIPQTFTDLEFRLLLRGGQTGTNFTHVTFSINNNTAGMYSANVIRMDGGSSPAIQGNTRTNNTYGYMSYDTGADAPADSFGASTLLLFNYASTNTYKAWRHHSSGNQNISPNYTTFGGGVIDTNTAISSVEFRSDQFSATHYASGSEFYLYGIKRN